MSLNVPGFKKIVFSSRGPAWLAGPTGVVVRWKKMSGFVMLGKRLLLGLGRQVRLFAHSSISKGSCQRGDGH